MKIDWAIKAEGKDVTENFRPYLVSISVKDEAKDEADSCTIVLDNSSTLLQQPVQGDELEIFLGYVGAITSVGKYTVDKASFTGPPDTLTIQCKSAAFVKTELNKLEQSFKDQKKRSWEPSNVLAIATKIAAEHGVELVTSEPAVLQAVVTPHLDQDGESDLSFLSSRLDLRGWFVKVANNKLIIERKSVGLSVNAKTGEKIPPVTLNRSEVSSYSGEWSERAVFDKAIAQWHNPETGEVVYETAGTGNRVWRFKTQAPDQKTAQDWAKNILTRSAGTGGKMSMSMAGRTDLQAEQLVTCEGFPYPLSVTPTKSAIAKQWVIKSVELSLSGGGFTTSISGEPYIPPPEPVTNG